MRGRGTARRASPLRLRPLQECEKERGSNTYVAPDRTGKLLPMNQTEMQPTEAIALPNDQMPEVEVMLRLAFYLLSLEDSADECTITPDCQHVESAGRAIFPLVEFLSQEGWKLIEGRGNEPWEGMYTRDGKRLIIIATPSHADVFIRIDKRLIRAECKKGPLVKRPGSPERPIMHKLIGQLMMSKAIEPDEWLLAAVPNTERFRKLVASCRAGDRLKPTGITFVLVGRDGSVEGFASPSTSS